jgi:4-carboxymuconolactone decarboxylase
MTERLRKLEPSELTPAQRAIYDEFGPGGNRASVPGAIPLMDDEGHLNGPPGIWLLHPPLGEAFQQLGLVFRAGLELTRAAQEIMILVHAQRLNAAFERVAHESAAARAGVAAADIEALSAGRSVSFADPEQQVCYEVAVALMDHGGLTDAEYARAVEQLGESRLLEATSLIGWYYVVALQLSVFGIVPPE